MFELPEYVTLASQINSILTGKTIVEGIRGNTPHKFVWYNRTPEEFSALTKGKKVGKAWVEGRWLFVPLEPGYTLLFGECGGHMLYHAPESKVPEKYHLLIAFADDSHFSMTTQMWGAMELFDEGKERERQYVKDMRITPTQPEFTFDYFSQLIDTLCQQEKRSVKSLLTQDQLIPGLGNSIAQDIMFIARLSPRHAIDKLSAEERNSLYKAIRDTVDALIAKGGRNDECDLFGKHGGYVRLMDKNAVAKPCPVCGTLILKMAYLGGSCYYCPECQK